MKTAVFYDLENIGLPLKNGEFEKAVVKLRQRIESCEFVGEISLQRAYMRSSNSSVPQIVPILEKHGIEFLPVAPIFEDGRKKSNLVDFKMGVDVVATVAKKRSISTVALASGDNDFGFLCQQIKNMDKKLLIISRFHTTSPTMLALCDDWLDISEHKLQPKYITKAIKARIPESQTDEGFYSELVSFMKSLKDDLLIRRYMSEFGLPFSCFEGILHSRSIGLPKFHLLGFPNSTVFLETLLSGTNFEPKSGLVKYIGKQNPISQAKLLESVIRCPPGYSREKLMKYYDLLKELESVDELARYINFMKRNGMLKSDVLCGKRTFRATIRKHLRAAMKQAGVDLDEATLSEIVGKL